MFTLAATSAVDTSLVEDFDAAFDAIIVDADDDDGIKDDDDAECISFTSIL